MISIKKSLSLHVQADRLWLLGALLLLLAVALIGAVPCESAAPALRLRGSVACLDCAAGHDLSGTYTYTGGLVSLVPVVSARPTRGA